MAQTQQGNRGIPHEHKCTECGYIHGCDNPSCSIKSRGVCMDFSPDYRTGIKFAEHRWPVRPVEPSMADLDNRIAEIEKRYYSAVVIDNKLAELQKRIEELEKQLGQKAAA